MMKNAVVEWLDWILKIGPLEYVDIVYKDYIMFNNQIGNIPLMRLCEISKRYAPAHMSQKDGHIVIYCDKIAD